MTQWWAKSVVNPCQANPSGGDAAVSNTINVLEGLAASSVSATFGPWQGAHTKTRNKATKGNVTTKGAGKSEACFTWNRGHCVSPCPQGRPHVCQSCGGGHRLTECPAAAPSGKGNKTKGTKGKGGKGKGKWQT